MSWGETATSMPKTSWFESLLSTFGKKPKRDNYIGSLSLFGCKGISTDFSNQKFLLDYILDDYQFSDSIAEYYKALNFSSTESNDFQDFELFGSSVSTIAVLPLTLQNLSDISRELAIMRSTSNPNILRYLNISHRSSYLLLEMPFIIRLSDLIRLVKIEKLDDNDQCVPERPTIRIIHGILKGLCGLHEMKIWHSRLTADCIYISVNDSRVMIGNWKNAKPKKRRINRSFHPIDAYWAPEQVARAKGLDAHKLNDSPLMKIDTRLTEKVDSWALGMIIYELTLGQSIYSYVNIRYYHPERQFSLSRLILYHDFPTLHEICPNAYHSRLNDLLIRCLYRDITSRFSAIDLIEHFEHFFLSFETSKNLVLEAIGDIRLLGAVIKPQRMKNFACHAADETPQGSLLPILTKDIGGKLKWKRLDLDKILHLRSVSLSLGDSHLYIKVRKESFFSRSNPFIYVQSIIPIKASNAIMMIQESIFQLVKDKTLKKSQALIICSIISQLTEFTILDQAPLSDALPDSEQLIKDVIFSETLESSEGFLIQSVLVPLIPLPKNILVTDYSELRESILIEYAYHKRSK